MKHLNDTELEHKLRNLVGDERAVLAEIVAHIMEVDRRQLYLKRARRSLFNYLTEELGYAEATAQRKIDAARLAAELPEVIEKIRSGELCLNQIGALQKGIRHKQKQSQVSTQMKREAMARVQSAPSGQADRVVAEYFEMPVVRRTMTQAQADGSMRVSVTIPAEVWEKLERCCELLAHKVPDGQWAAILGELCEAFLREKDPDRRPPTSAAEVKPQKDPSGAIPPKLRRYIFQRDKVCQYRDPATGRLCGSRFQLEVDHIRMRCRGGTNEPLNLRLLCRQHNQLAAKEALGERARPGSGVSPGGPSGKNPPGGDLSP